MDPQIYIAFTRCYWFRFKSVSMIAYLLSYKLKMYKDHSCRLINHILLINKWFAFIRPEYNRSVKKYPSFIIFTNIKIWYILNKFKQNINFTSSMKRTRKENVSIRKVEQWKRCRIYFSNKILSIVIFLSFSHSSK